MHEKPSPLFEAILENPHADAILAGSGFSLVDYASRHIVLSKSFRELDLSAESFSDSIIESALHPADRPNLRKLFKSLQSGADGGEGEFRFLADDGSTMWLALSFHVITREENGALKHLVIHDDNITELIAAQEEIRERLVEIESLKDLLSSINKSLDFNETINKIIEHLHRIIPFDRASVQTLEGNFLLVIGGYGYPEADFENLRFPVTGIDNPSARAIASRRPIICNDVEHDFEGFIQVGGGIVVKSWLGIPLVYEGRAIGLFALDSAQPDFYTDQHVRLASNVAEHIAMAIAHAWQHTMVKEEARTDKLTGIGNRYGLETKGQEIFGKAAKDDEPLGTLMIDIDHFKTVNDSFGHAYGDQALRAIAAEIQKNLRIKDYPVRFGGEEFVILLPDTSTREALVVAERLRGKISRIDMDGTHKCPTVSIGVFSGVPGPQDLMHEFIRRADLALYEAKEAGRNRCRVWSPKPEYFDKQI
jgi:diguanylate cyclase (GGDEF)-like protein